MPQPSSRGHLNPGAPGVSFDRFELGPGLGALVRHVWVVRWDVPEGESRPQRVLAYPAFNAVIQAGGATVAGPDPALSVRALRGTGWALGVLFRPAAGPVLASVVGTEVRELVGREMPVLGAPVDAIRRTRERPGGAAARHESVRVLRAWLGPLAAGIGEHGRAMNAVARIAEEEHDVVRAGELAARAGLGVRSLERLVREHLGVTPKWLIECRRLQFAATTLHSAPATDLSALAAELGYADYPHFSHRYAAVIGETPEQTRRSAPPPSLAPPPPSLAPPPSSTRHFLPLYGRDSEGK